MKTAAPGPQGVKRTTQVIAVATAALVAYDIYVAATPERGDTLSEVIARAARQRPIIAAAAGVLFGHWFWPLGRARGGAQTNHAREKE